MRVLLFLSLLGLACCLEPSKKYTYKYFGSTETGIPEISSQGSGAAVKADIVIEVPRNEHAIVTLSNVEFAQLNGELGMYSTPTGTYKFSPLQDRTLSDILKSPFTVNLLGNPDFAIHTQSEDPMWINNLRKAIVSSFRNQVVMSNFQDPHSRGLPILQSGKFPRSFEVLEQSTFGLCNMQYTIQPLPDFIGGRLLPQMQSEQGQKSAKTYYRGMLNAYSKPNMELLQVTRTVDFDSCQHSVSLHRSSPQFRPSQQAFQRQSPTGRSSVGEYIVIGSKGSFTIEQANIQGQISAKAFGATAELLQSNTNQTLELVSIDALGTPTVVNHKNAKPIKNWMQEIISSKNQPKVSPELPFVVYTGKQGFLDTIATVTGLQTSQSEEQQRQRSVMESLQQAAQQLSVQTSISQGQNKQVINEIKQAVEILEGMSKTSLRQLVQQLIQVPQQDNVKTIQRKLLIDAIASSGTAGAIELLIELTKAGQLNDFEALTVTNTIVQNLQDPTVMPQLVEFAMGLNLKSRPFLGAAALLNVATVANHLCVNQTTHTATYASEVFGDQVCDVQLIENKFVPYLQKLIHDESLTFERIVAIHALSRLRTARSVEILAPVILGQKGRSSILRATAINAIRRNEQPEESRKAVLDLLSQIRSNIAEEPRLRMSALVTASLWSPGAVFWNKIARDSWKEPSMTMVSAYKSLLESMSSTQHPVFEHDRRAASQALKTTRPMFGQRHMVIQKNLLQSFDQQMSVYQEYIAGNHQDLVKNTNFEFIQLLHSTVNGLQFTDLEIDISGGAFGKLKDTPHTNYETSSQYSKMANDIFQQIQKAIEFSPRKQFAGSDKIVNVYMKVLENIQVLLPMTEQTMSNLPFKGLKSWDDIKQQMQKGIEMMIGQFASPVTHNEFYPNELGLPVLVTQSFDIVMANTMKIKGAISSQDNSVLPRKAHVDVVQHLRAISQTTGKIQVLLPWTNTKISTSSESTRDFIAPVEASVDFEIAQSSNLPSHFEFSLKPATSQKFNVLSATNRPTASIQQLSFTGPRQQPQVIEIQRAQSTQQSIPISQSFTGLDLSVQWESQFRSPINMLNIQTRLRDLFSSTIGPQSLNLFASETAQKWNLYLQYDPSSSQTNNMLFQTKCNPTSVSGDATIMDPGHSKSTQQQRQDQHTHEQNMQMGETNSIFQQELNGQTCAAVLKLTGRQERKYELNYSRTQPKFEGQKQTVKTHLGFVRSALPGFDSKPMSVCLDSKQVSPIISVLDTLQTLQSRELKSQVSTTITPGCQSASPAVTAETFLRMSKDQMEQIRIQAKQMQEIQQSLPVQTVLSQAVYDDIQSNVQWKKVCQQQGSYVNNILSVFNTVFLRGIGQIDCGKQQDSANLQINLRRNAVTTLWQLIATDGQNNFQASDISIPMLGERIASLDVLPAPQLQSSFFKYQPRSSQLDTCFIQSSAVQSFAGSRYAYTASNCFTVAVTDCVSEAFTVLTRSSSSGGQSQDVKILDRKNGAVVEITNNAVKVNGQNIDLSQARKQVTSEAGRVVAEVFKQNGHVMVIIPEFVVVAVKDQVEITVTRDQQVCGACGNANGEQQFDLAGPKQCLYPQGNLFAASWTSAAEKCDDSNLNKLRQQVRTFQQTCQKLQDVEGQMSYDKFPLTYQYVVRQQGPLLCASVSPQPNCKSSLKVAATASIQVTFNCWEQTRAPQALKSAKGYMQQAIVQQPLTTIQQNIDVPARCA